jgi:hypothetical protein
MKRNKQSVRNKTANVYGELDTFERKKKRQQKLNRGKKSFANQYEHEHYLDNIDYYESPSTLEDYE